MYAMVPSSRMGQRQREAWGMPSVPGIARQGGSEQFKLQFYHASDVGNSPPGAGIYPYQSPSTSTNRRSESRLERR